MSAFETIGIAGAGAWGTALANACARAGQQVVLWGRDHEQMTSLEATRINSRYLPESRLEAHVVATSDAGDLTLVDALLVVLPVQSLRSALPDITAGLKTGTPVISCAKGIERGTLLFPTQIIHQLAPAHPTAVLSGPSFAADVVKGLPTAVTLATESDKLATQLAQCLSSPNFRIYHSTDIIGVEIGAAAKNVLAIAAGIAAGRQLGASAGAALIARGFAELSRLGVALGACSETLMGLSGLGDLVLTATSCQSRNFALGLALGAGEPPPPQLAEGAFTAQALVQMANQQGVDMPLAQAVCDVLAGGAVDQVVDALLARPLKAEHGRGAHGALAV